MFVLSSLLHFLEPCERTYCQFTFVAYNNAIDYLKGH